VCVCVCVCVCECVGYVCVCVSVIGRREGEMVELHSNITSNRDIGA